MIDKLLYLKCGLPPGIVFITYSQRFFIQLVLIPIHDFLVPVIVLIQRRHYEQVKHAVPVILKVLTTVCTNSDEDVDYENLFHKATGIASSIRKISTKLVCFNYLSCLILFIFTPFLQYIFSSYGRQAMNSRSSMLY